MKTWDELVINVGIS